MTHLLNEIAVLLISIEIAIQAVVFGVTGNVVVARAFAVVAAVLTTFAALYGVSG